MRCIFLFLLVGWCALGLSAQKLSSVSVMTINGKCISLHEFQRAYDAERKEEKNLSLEAFVDRFVWRYLEIAEARKMGLDTTQAFYVHRAEEKKRMQKAFFLDSLHLKDDIATYVTPSVRRSLQVACLYKYLPQSASNKEVKQVCLQMDSLYQVLQQGVGGDFEDLVARFSDEKQSHWIQALEVTEEMEKVAFSLKKGEVSAPFGTPHGICMLKLLDEKVEADSCQSDCVTAFVWKKQPVFTSILNRLKVCCAFVPNESAIQELLHQGHTEQVLFTIGEKKYTVSQFDCFAKANSFSTKNIWNEFVLKSLLDYADDIFQQKWMASDCARKGEEDYLVREIEKRKIDVPSQQDRIGLSAYFEVHRADYYWKEPRFRGIVFHCKDKRIAKELKKSWKKLPKNEWKQSLAVLESRFSSECLRVEKGDFERGENPWVDQKFFRGPKSQLSATHPYVVFIGEKIKGPEDYREVWEKVKKDYRSFLWNVWKRELLASAQVEINNLVLKSVNNN